MNTEDIKKTTSGFIKNPILKFATYALIAMVIGIGAAWVLLGICSPVLLVLLIQHW